MSLFSLSQRVAIDLGTANTIIISDGKIVVDEPSVVAIRKSDDKMIAVGKKASPMQDRGESRIYTIRPPRKGVIADYKACEAMIRGMIDLIPCRSRFFTRPITMVVCVPSGATPAEIRTISDSCQHAGARELYLIYEPMAAALGMGFDIEGPQGCMVVDIGGGTTEIAVMSLGALVVNESIPIAGDAFNQDIVQYMDKSYSMRISEPTAERIKKQVGSALMELQDPPENMLVIGPNKTTDLPPQNACQLSGDSALHGQEYLHDRSRHTHSSAQNAVRTLRRHCRKRHLPYRRRRIAARSCGTAFRQDEHPLPCGGRPAAFSGKRHIHSPTESARPDVSASHRIISVTTAESDNIPTHRENCCLDT